MKKFLKIIIVILSLLGIFLFFFSFIQSHTIAVLEPKGWIALKEKNLIITASLLMLIVVIPVLAMTLFFSYRYRESNTKAKHTPDWEHNALAEYFWWGVPFIIILCLAAITWKSSYELNPFKPLQSLQKPIRIQAIALQWKWLFIYPDENIASTNFIQFPVDTPLHFEITSDAPMNSFWIPQLGGQIYAMPAMKSELHLIANEKGTFKGLSANISGTNFSKMQFSAKASCLENYKKWIEKAKSSPLVLDAQEYERIKDKNVEVTPTIYILKDHKLFEEVIKKYMTSSQSP